MNTFFIQGPAGRIETMIDYTKKTLHDDITAVICHPHPQFQGTMNNKVITTMSRAFNNLGINAFRFNYRGVGESQGHYDQGNGEIDDLQAVIDYIAAKKSQQKILLAGFSFGGSVAYKAAMYNKDRAISLLTIAPAVINFPLTHFEQPTMPWCLIQGIDDEAVSYHAVMQFFLEQTQCDATLIRLNHVGHFFHGQLVPLRKHIEKHYQSRLTP